MAHRVVGLDNIRESFGSTGTTITLGGAAENSRAFSAELASGDTFWGVARKGAEFTAGIFTYTSGSPGSIAQTDVRISSNAGAAVNFLGGVGEVYIDAPSFLFDHLNIGSVTVTCAATTNIGTADGKYISLGGTTTITSFGSTTKNKERVVTHSGEIVTHNATTLKLLGGITWQTNSGDRSGFKQDASGNWAEIWRSYAAGSRIRASGTVTLYTNYSTGSNTTGTGTSGNPFKTVTYAAYYIADNYDLNDRLAVVQMADNVTDSDGLHWAVHGLHGAQGGAALTIKGGTNSVLSAAQNYFGAVIQYQNLTIRDDLAVDYGAFVYLNGVTFGAGAATAPISVGFGSRILCNGAINIGAINCFAAVLVSGGYFDSGSQTVTIAANQTVSGGWLYVNQGGAANFGNSTLTNAFTVTGPRFTIYDGGDVTSGNGTITYFPGSTVGVNNSGYYDSVTAPPPTTIITGHTDDTTPDGAADYLLTYDASAATLKKTLLKNATAFKVGTFMRDTATASGTQAVTGVGFKPKAIIFLTGLPGAGNKASIGLDDGSGHMSLSNYNAASAGAWISSNSQSIVLYHSGVDIYFGAVSSFDTDGFTFSWTKSGSPTGTVDVMYLALR